MGNSILFNELNLEQRRRLIDVQQKADVLRENAYRLRDEFAGSMSWKSRSGQDYLYRREGRVEKSLGKRSPETEVAFQGFQIGKKRLLERRRGVEAVLRGWAPVTRALRLGRVPRSIARILRRLDAADLLGREIHIAGGIALLAYEAMTGLVCGKDIVGSLDGLELVTQMAPKILFGHLREIDSSFVAAPSNPLRFQNAGGVWIEVVHSATERPPVGVHAIGVDGMPVWISAVHPVCCLSLWRPAPPPALAAGISQILSTLDYAPCA